MKKFIFYFLVLIVIISGCKEKYLPPITSPPTGYLVVEGYINSGQQPTSIMLSRTTKLYDPVQIVYEPNALVNVESENNETFPLYDNGNGMYVSSGPLNLNGSVKYRLQIRTLDGKEYVSDFVAVKRTPEIDTVSWQRENDGGVKIYVNTHDDQNNTRYYRWKFEETWEIHSRWLSNLAFVFNPTTGNAEGLVYRNPQQLDDSSIFKCWQTNIPSNIYLGSSEKLSSDKIYLPLVPIEPHSEKLSVLYSIHVRQYALDHDAYLFYSKIKKNTEQVGSIFDAQPSELQGNIHCVGDPQEIVVGYVGVSEEKDSRIFISNDQLPGWNYAPDCPQIVFHNESGDIQNAAGLSLTPTHPDKLDAFGGIIDFKASPTPCVDCTTKGTNVKPPFWP
jgi:hypothetical protein